MKSLIGNFDHEELDKDKKYCHIRFSDNGIGFDPKHTQRVFEVIRRLHTRNYAGTGIGLAIVKKIVENHYGFIFATGKIDEGSTFDIYVPVE